MVSAFKTTAPFVAAFIAISSATVTGAVPVTDRVEFDVVMPSNAAVRLAAVSS